ncbi:U-box domain-containing protein 33 [Acorus calamus]|uniref:RING-type E3 ubiquitin transferase n=1 Tax=Acorus calamus TaxID=4465 RepID=A0AAV9EJF5_ACOCL|nr:U-box domain-containing protein 33 [Acorus calamus]
MKSSQSAHSFSPSSSSSSTAARSVSISEIEESSPPDEEMVYVAVGKNMKETKTLLDSVLREYSGRRSKIGILHVHQPDQWIPMGLGGKFPAESLSTTQLKAHRLKENEKVQKMLDGYLLICAKQKVPAEKIFINRDDIGKGIVELVVQLGIRRLVMGSQYSKSLRAPRSKTAVFVQHEAPPSCRICFICPQNIICTRYTQELYTVDFFEDMKTLVSAIVHEGTLAIHNRCITIIGDHWNDSDPRSTLTTGVVDDIWEGDLTRQSNSTWTDDGLSSVSLSITKDQSSEDSSILQSVRKSEEGLHDSYQVQLEASYGGEGLVKYQLQQTMEEVNKAKQEAYKESLKRQKAEMAAFEACMKAKRLEKLYIEEKQQRRELEEALRMTTLDVQSLKSQRDKNLEELQRMSEQRLAIEIQIANPKQTVEELEEKLQSAQNETESLQSERDALKRERDNVVIEAENMLKAVTLSSQRACSFTEFTYTEIKKATNNFNDSLKIGEGGYGSVYKGFLHHTEVAIKMLHPDSYQGHEVFYQELNVLSKVRHPNLVTLIGACPEAWALVYEFFPNGSLEDRLKCKDGTTPLTWQVRTRIASEICAALIFLHSNNPQTIIHGNLKPGNILLGANFISKLSDFGIFHLLHNLTNSPESPTTTLCHRTDPKGTFAYMDPEFSSTGELTHQSDVYSFGVILLQLLTAIPAFGIQKVVQDALDRGNLIMVLDVLAGEWPCVQAKQLADLGLRCCEMNRKNRPDLASEVWRVLEPMKVSSGVPSSFRLAVGDSNCIPSYFMCPIFQEIMRDPHIAADGYTYEAEALKGWLESGNETSPMTNLKLSHQQLVPNRALRSAIEEWRQQQQLSESYSNLARLI